MISKKYLYRRVFICLEYFRGYVRRLEIENVNHFCAWLYQFFCYMYFACSVQVEKYSLVWSVIICLDNGLLSFKLKGLIVYLRDCTGRAHAIISRYFFSGLAYLSFINRFTIKTKCYVNNRKRTLTYTTKL